MFLKPLFGFFNDETTTSTTQPPPTTVITEDPYAGLTQKDCELKVETDPLPEMPLWFYYPSKSECWEFAVWETYNQVNWRRQWYKKVCDKIHDGFMAKKKKELIKSFKDSKCLSPEVLTP